MPKVDYHLDVHDLERLANEIRKDVIKMLLEAGSGHSAGPLALADIFTALYFHLLNVNPKKPTDPNRDRFVLSAGHLCPVWYATLAHRGFFPHKELKTLRKLGSRLQGHPHFNMDRGKGVLPGIENASGPLGQGISQAIGMALAGKMDGAKWRVYCLGSDGELQEGQIWEAAMFAGNSKLHNLIWIIDRNNIQIDGFTEDVMPLEPLKEKLEMFHWHVIEVDGHNFHEFISACMHAKAIYERPAAIIAHTIPGKGVEFMEKDFHWHGVPPNKDQAKKALHGLRTLGGKIRGEHE